MPSRHPSSIGRPSRPAPAPRRAPLAVRARYGAALLVLALAGARGAAGQGAPAPGAPARGAAPAQGVPAGGGRGAAAQLEAQLPQLRGAERVRALARLVDLHKLDAPAAAVAYGSEALALIAASPDSAALAAPRLATLNELTWAYLTLARLDSAAASAEAARELAVRTGDRAALARALSNLGSVAQRRGNPHAAIGLFDDALAIQRATGADSAVANSLNNLGFVYATDLADYGRGLASHLEALRIRERIGDRSGVALSLNNVGIVYARLRQYDRALQHFERSLAIRRALGARTRVAATLGNIGDVHLERGDLVPALAAYEESLALREAAGERGAVSLGYRNLAMVHLAMRHLDSARTLIDHALANEVVTGDRGLLVRNLLTRAAVHQASGRLADATRDVRAALVVAEAAQSRELVRRALESLVRVEEAAGRFAAALDAQKRLRAVSDSIFDEAAARRVSNVEAQDVRERRESERAQLRREEAARRAAEARAATQRNVAVLVVLVLGALVGAAFRARIARTRAAEELSFTDALTGLRNRHYVQQTIDADLAASLRRHRAAAARGRVADDADLVFQLIDIDHFKRVNDEYGHAVGDRVLAEVAGVLQRVARASDVVVRWGGEEFLIVNRFVDAAQAGVFAERLRHAIAAHVIVLEGGRTLRVTASIGFAAFPFSLVQPLACAQVLALADCGTYAAKRAGRDAWVGYQHLDGVLPPEVIAAPRAALDALVAGGMVRRVSSVDADAAQEPGSASLAMSASERVA